VPLNATPVIGTMMLFHLLTVGDQPAPDKAVARVAFSDWVLAKMAALSASAKRRGQGASAVTGPHWLPITVRPGDRRPRARGGEPAAVRPFLSVRFVGGH
jgi:hypothetical protein